MVNNFVLTVAMRYFRAKKNEKFVSVIAGFSLLGVTIGVATLIVVMSVMNGFREELTKNIIGLNGDIVITSTDNIITNYLEVKQQLSAKDYITHLLPSITGQALATGPRTNSGALIIGIDLGDLKFKNQILANVKQGDFANFNGKNVVALGAELAFKLGVGLHDKIALIAPNLISTAFGSIPRSKKFEIIAIFSSGLYDYDAAIILMPMIAARNFLSVPDGINSIEIYTKLPSCSAISAEEIQTILGAPFKVTSWLQSHRQLLNALDTERAAMFTILSLIIIVAAFNIVSSLVMLVKDKTKDIAILRTIGASSRQIMLIFICNGLLVGIIGTVLGTIIGSSLAYNINVIKNYLEQITGTKFFEAAIYFLNSLPSSVRIENIILIATISLTLCFLATIYPAYRASRLSPVELLRYE